MPLFIMLQKGQENGPNPTAQYGGSSDSPNKDAQLPTIRIKSSKSLLFKIEYIMRSVNPKEQYSFH
ncbi:hypothetical protein NQ314_009298 [Rhamnusium bicolor]|uniref:Uncharacterized protein n=1 Tax=Rhamnusium bicolor TaxID=1586634 RepID=A0AAV8Y177_9CUCU|nr:hypothetical protein NQ314_009298 [Rhamnusium bicolor]